MRKWINGIMKETAYVTIISSSFNWNYHTILLYLLNRIDSYEKWYELVRNGSLIEKYVHYLNY